MTIWLTVVTMALAHPRRARPGAAAPVAGMASVSAPATAFVEFFRATPLILQIYWAYYVLPAYFDIQLSQLTTAIVGLSCNISAFNSETFRAGIVSIRAGPVECRAGARHEPARRCSSGSSCRRR